MDEEQLQKKIANLCDAVSEVNNYLRKEGSIDSDKWIDIVHHKYKIGK